MSKTQRDYYLREQLRQIKHELGDGDVHGEEMEELRAKVETRRAARRGARPRPTSRCAASIRCTRRAPRRGVLRTLHRVADRAALERRPARTCSTSRSARRILDEDHYDLEHIKDRILDYLAVRKLRGGAHGPILCFLGPPGVGKTSLGRSIARAMGRKFVRISLGGVRDEAEIRGHRRTYVGALPGRIIQALKQAGTNNPVMLLDEVDKLGADVRGDPSAALLEVLDPEQNHTFRDHYLGVPFDLSKVLFIATANLPETIPPPLRDRMETLRLSGYSEEEKLVIAERYLVPKQIAEAGLTANEIVDRPRRAAPDRLRVHARVGAARARAPDRAAGAQGRPPGGRGGGARADGARREAPAKPRGPTIGVEELPTFLGPPRYIADERHGAAEVGTVNGLAWTPYGGEVLHVEAQTMAGKGSLILTGQLGDVMKESAQAALSFARAHALALGLRERVLRRARDPHPRPGGRRAQGRSVGGRDHGLRAGVADRRASRCATTWR